MKEQEPGERTVPTNMTIAWSTSDVSYCDATYREWFEDKQRHGQVRLLGIFRDEGVLPDKVYKDLFEQTMREARKFPKNTYHYVRIDNRKYVPEDSNNCPFSDATGWQKDMVLWGYHYHSNGGRYV